MKTSNNLFKAAIIVLAVLAISSCRKDETDSITTDDATDALTYALQSGSGGYSQQLSDAADYAYTEGYGKNGAVSGLSCGVPFDTAVSFVHTGTITANYNHSWTWTLNCTGPVPNTLDFEGTYNGNYDGPRMQSTNSGGGDFNITGIQPGPDVYTFNGNYTRNGSVSSKVRNKNTFTTQITVVASNITVSKATYKITGGNATATVQCSSSAGKVYNYDAAIVFNGDGTAAVTINGQTTTIQLY